MTDHASQTDETQPASGRDTSGDDGNVDAAKLTYQVAPLDVGAREPQAEEGVRYVATGGGGPRVRVRFDDDARFGQLGVVGESFILFVTQDCFVWDSTCRFHCRLRLSRSTSFVVVEIGQGDVVCC